MKNHIILLLLLLGIWAVPKTYAQTMANAGELAEAKTWNCWI